MRDGIFLFISEIFPKNKKFNAYKNCTLKKQYICYNVKTIYCILYEDAYGKSKD